MLNLLRLREKRRLTQVALHIATGIDQSLLSKYERGERLPSVSDLMILADFFPHQSGFSDGSHGRGSTLPARRENPSEISAFFHQKGAYFLSLKGKTVCRSSFPALQGFSFFDILFLS